MIITNGIPLYDTEGKVLHAHGGFMLRWEGLYYWYGENRLEDIYVSCYASKDLHNWEFRKHILTADSQTEAIRVRSDLKLRNEKGGKVNLERPKVLYNEKTGKFVLWAHYENGMDYHCAAAAVASCDTPDGDFVYHGSFRPFGHIMIERSAGNTVKRKNSRKNGAIIMYAAPCRKAFNLLRLWFLRAFDGPCKWE